jgi:hypothetical protein
MAGIRMNEINLLKNFLITPLQNLRSPVGDISTTVAALSIREEIGKYFFDNGNWTTRAELCASMELSESLKRLGTVH